MFSIGKSTCLAFWEPSQGSRPGRSWRALGPSYVVLGGSWVALGPSYVVLGGSWPALASSLGGPGVAAITKLPSPRTYSLYRYTRVDPCIKCTRSKLATGEVDTAFVDRKDLLSVCCLVLPLVLSSVVLSPLVSSCLGFSALVSSCVVCWASPGPFLGLSGASLGTHFRPPEGHFEAPGGS